MQCDAVVTLENGVYFRGYTLNNQTFVTGELCFLTAQTGYQEAATDPSYADQILVFTFPHIGITGINNIDYESASPKLKAVVLSSIESQSDHYLKNSDLIEWLLKHKVPVIFGVDTRSLVHHIRSNNGPVKGSIASDDNYNSISELLSITAQSKGLSGNYIANCNTTYHGTNSITDTKKFQTQRNILLIDFGVKNNIVCLLRQSNCLVHICPPTIDTEYIKNSPPDGIVLSNGPGDPGAVFLNHKELIIYILSLHIPVLGVCMGYQLIALAFGAKTQQMKAPHHGINHPVHDLVSKKVVITSQNHEFEVIENSIDKNIITITHRSLFDDSIEGIAINNKRITAVQFHPEGCPGPQDSIYIFDNYIKQVNSYAISQRH